MKCLDEVYLANVILYVKSIETIVKLMQVNKKCQDAIKIIRYYGRRKLYERDEEDYFNYCVVKNVFDLFPNIETIDFRADDIKKELEISDKVAQIELRQSYFTKIESPQEIKDKIVILEFSCYSLRNIKLNEFPNVKKVKVSYYEEGYLKEFLGNNQLKLRQLIIQTEDKKELDILMEYNNIEKKILKIRDEITKKRYEQLIQFASVYVQRPIDGIDLKDTFDFFNFILVSNFPNINRLYDLTLFTKCYVESCCDLRNCELLEEIIISYYSNNENPIQIEGLKHLKRIGYIKKVDCIPSNVTYLSFNPSFDYKELLEKDIDCFANIKEVKFEIARSERIENSTIFMNFQTCTKIEVKNYNSPITSLSIPENVKEFEIDNIFNNEQTHEIAKLTSLKKLSFGYNFRVDKQEIQKMYNKLKELEWLKTNYIDGIKLPSTLTYLNLDLNYNDSIDLRQTSNLKEIKLYNPSKGNKQIKLPNKLNKLLISGNIVVTNSKEVEIERIIFNDTPSQFCEWTSKNIFIQKVFEIKK